MKMIVAFKQHHIVGGKKFGCSAADRIKKFYRCANAIFRIDGRSNDLIMLRLIEAHCIPILTYTFLYFVSKGVRQFNQSNHKDYSTVLFHPSPFLKGP